MEKSKIPLFVGVIVFFGIILQRFIDGELSSYITVTLIVLVALLFEENRKRKIIRYGLIYLFLLLFTYVLFNFV